MGVLLKYVENPEIFEAKPKFLDKFRNLVSQMVTRFSGTKEVAIDNNEEVLNLQEESRSSKEEVDTSQQVDIRLKEQPKTFRQTQLFLKRRTSNLKILQL